MKAPPPSLRRIPPPHVSPMTQRQAQILKAPPNKIDPVQMDRNVAQAHAPRTTQGDLRTDAFTYFTKADITDRLYNGDRLWARVLLTLESAGPVAVGTRATITPVLSGQGQLLTTGQTREFIIGKGTVLYIASTTVNRVSVTIEPIAWAEQITGLITALLTGASVSK